MKKTQQATEIHSSKSLVSRRNERKKSIRKHVMVLKSKHITRSLANETTPAKTRILAMCVFYITVSKSTRFTIQAFLLDTVFTVAFVNLFLLFYTIRYWVLVCLCGVASNIIQFPYSCKHKQWYSAYCMLYNIHTKIVPFS